MYRLLEVSRPCSNLGRWQSVLGPFTELLGWTYFGDLFLRNPADGQHAILLLWWSRFVPLSCREPERFEDTFLRRAPVIEQLLRPADVLALEERLGKLGPEQVFVQEACPLADEGGDALAMYSKTDVWAFAALTAACHRIGENAVLDVLLRHLRRGDDIELWRVVLDTVFADFAVVGLTPGTLVQVGRCSHWLRPHQTRWTADGGFAWPTGYGSGEGGHSRNALPQFDWSVTFAWTGEGWSVAHNKSAKPALRITIPARTARHRQAAIHTLWMTGKEKERRFYGFRRQDGAWRCTADSPRQEDRGRVA